MAQSSTRVLRCDPSSIQFHSDEENPDITCPETLSALKTAAHHLTDLSEPVAFPTETVYGLGAMALSPHASTRIFTTKGRPADNPLIVHVSSFTMLRSLLPDGYVLPRTYQALIKHFWPGPLTLLFPSDPEIVPTIITAGHPTVAIRMPSHPVARALIAVAKTPLAAPSANSSGKPSPTKAEHVLRDLEGKISVILDGGPCDVGLESTVVDGLHEDGKLRILRPGGVTVENIRHALEEEMHDSDGIPDVLVHRRDYTDDEIEQAPTTPGMKYRHYAPSVPLSLLMTTSLPPTGEATCSASQFFDSLKAAQVRKIGVLAPTDSALWDLLPADGFEWLRFPLGPTAEPAVYAHRLFDGLLSLEREGVDQMLIEEVREDREGLAVMNRVKKAAGEHEELDTSVFTGLDLTSFPTSQSIADHRLFSTPSNSYYTPVYDTYSSGSVDPGYNGIHFHPSYHQSSVKQSSVYGSGLTFPSSSPISTPTSDPRKVPRPSNAFMLYRSDFLKRKIIPPNVEHRQQNLSRIIGQCWNLLPAKEKELWQERAREALIKHRKDHPGYKFTPAPRGSHRMKGKDRSDDYSEVIISGEDHIRMIREKYAHIAGPAASPGRRRRPRVQNRNRDLDVEAVYPLQTTLSTALTPSPAPLSPSLTSIYPSPENLPEGGNSLPSFFPQYVFSRVAPPRRPSTSLGFATGSALHQDGNTLSRPSSTVSDSGPSTHVQDLGVAPAVATVGHISTPTSPLQPTPDPQAEELVFPTLNPVVPPASGCESFYEALSAECDIPLTAFSPNDGFISTLSKVPSEQQFHTLDLDGTSFSDNDPLAFDTTWGHFDFADYLKSYTI
ncbi:hypothetical protein H0H92_003405 [Tricholoma furcatifolium]|nr:hypothetical protein H0H92_003405 [Tricholoma furcatifolium]